MGTNLKELVVTYEANVKPLITALGSVENKIKRVTLALQSTSQSFFKLGRDIGLAFSTPLGVLGVASINASASMQGLEASLGSVLKKFNTGLPIQESVTAEIENLKSVANELGISFNDAVNPYVKYLAASKDSLETNRKVIKSFLSLGPALRLSNNQIVGIIRALEQMQSKQKVMSEELRLQLGDRLPGVISLFAKANKVKAEEFVQLMQQGKVSAKILSKVADVINKEYGEAVKKGSQLITANLNRIRNAFYMLKINIGQGIEQSFKVNAKMSKFAVWLDKVANNFDRLDDSGKKTILSIGGFLVALGPFLLTVAGIARILAIFSGGLNILFKVTKNIFALFRTARIMVVANPWGALLTGFFSVILYSKEIMSLFKTIDGWLDKLSAKLFSFYMGNKKNKLPKKPSILDGFNSTLEKDFINTFVVSKKLLSGLLPKNLSILDGFNSTLEKDFIKTFVVSKKLLTALVNSSNEQSNNNPSIFDISEGAKSSIATPPAMSPIPSNNNTKTINNNLIVNIPASVSAIDANPIKEAIKQALQEENRQTYIELGVQ